MTGQSFTAWAAPIAATLAEDRRRLIDFAESAQPEFWILPSVVDGWTNKDILAHLAGGNDLLVQTLLRALSADQQIDPKLLAPHADTANALGVAERGAWSIGQLIAELKRDHEEVLGWLAQLREDHRDQRPDGLGMTVGQFFRVVQHEHHDLIHLEQLRLTAPDH